MKRGHIELRRDAARQDLLQLKAPFDDFICHARQFSAARAGRKVRRKRIRNRGRVHPIGGIAAMAVVGAISQQIWDMKYRLRAPANGEVPGEPLDRTIEDTWRRVATALAAPEREPATWAERFYRAMEDFKFLPAGRVVAGAGSEPLGHLVQLLCDGDDPRRHGRDLRPSARGGADHAAGRRHRLRFLDAPARAARRSKASAPTPPGRCRSWMCGTRCAARS